MTRVRRDVWRLGDGWSDTLVWYARGIREMSKGRLDQSTSWRYFAAIHGFDERRWRLQGYFGDDDALPPDDEVARSWRQCQHQTWYFLPWHRGYLAAIEAVLCQEIVKLGGPRDWALPYWNYSDEAGNPRARELPPAFAAQAMPNGDPNPLKVAARYGDGSGSIVLDKQIVRLDPALREPAYTGVATGGSPGFGGPETAFAGHGPANGLLESVPHNLVHGGVGGGRSRDDIGLMSDPRTAGLDPIFWLHHANIDRLWEVWLKRQASHANPAEASWLTGPADRAFVMPAPDGSIVKFTAREMLDTTASGLAYIYEDTSDPLGGADLLAARFGRLGLAAAIGGAEMAGRPAAEMLGANEAAVRLDGGSVDTSVRMDRQASGRMARSLAAAADIASAGAAEPDRVFLNLEGIRGLNDAAMFDVYVNLPVGGAPADHPERHAGTVSLFGAAQASEAAGAQAGGGITTVLEITDIVDALHLSEGLDLDRLEVRFVPRTAVEPDDDISVSRVSVYRQGRS